MFIMDKMNRRCPELSIRNGVTNDEHIIVGDKDYALAELMPLEKELHLYVAPLWKAYWMKKEIRSWLYWPIWRKRKILLWKKVWMTICRRN